MIRTAIIGYGTWATRHHAPMLKAMKGFEVVAACDLSAKRHEAAREAHGIPVWETVTGLLATLSFDLAVVCAPPISHCDLTRELLRAGKHVLVEKPMAMFAKDCELMIAEARDADRVLAVYHQRRFDGDFRQALWAADFIRPLWHAEFVYHGWSDAAAHYGVEPWRAREPSSGGLLFDMGIHRVDQALALTGMTPKTVFGNVAARRFTAIDHYSLLIAGDDEAPTVQVAGSACARRGNGGIYLFGENGAYVDGILYAEGAEQSPPAYEPRPWSIYEEVRGAIETGAPLTVTPEDAMRAVAVCDAARESSRTGRAVSL